MQEGEVNAFIVAVPKVCGHISMIRNHARIPCSPAAMPFSDIRGSLMTIKSVKELGLQETGLPAILERVASVESDH